MVILYAYQKFGTLLEITCVLLFIVCVKKVSIKYLNDISIYIYERLSKLDN